MDKATRNKAVIADGAHFKGKIKNAHVIEINGTVEADLKADKVTIGAGGKFVGAINADLVVISGQYDGNMDAGSIWATANAQITGKIQYKTLQMDRGAALNCRVIHNWGSEKAKTKKSTYKETSAGDADLEDDHEIAGGSAAKTASKKVDAATSPDPAPDEAQKVENNDFELLTAMAKRKSAGREEPARGRRLGIFGFGSRSTKLPDTSGQ